ncbi:maleylacetoacetate isomerase [Sulfitobacter sp. S190]|uniref:maleylacetoacetate isomerase n=1 Tax=Sulfitobacter sp. S190 TaxID=2867022 RepID=UPI0021A94F24|nr:maleylacetoacetate isomerase [Sulfitobacter sp. S190]UWR22129.1 maleylacetoacetate isomerase [Sulfitobacter sp. S190]
MTLQIASATLYDFPFSSASYRLRIAMHLKGVAPHAVRGINLRTGEQLGKAFTDVTGAALVPALDFGERAYGQSIALIEWLDRVYPDPPLIPEDADAALAVRSLALTIACDIHPLNTPRVLKHLSGPMQQSDAKRADWYAHWVREGFTTLERQLTQTADRGPFCIGTTPTLADICLVPQVLNARRFGVAIDEFERVCAVEAHCRTLEAFTATAPKTD